MVEIAVIGAGGNMGRRITGALRQHEAYRLRLVESSPAGRDRVADLGLTTMPLQDALRGSDVVLFAVPDRVMRQVTAEVVPMVDAGSSLLFLDPAAVAADRVPRRQDVRCYVTHPTHPPLYDLLAEQDPDARRDYWGGGRAQQAAVLAVGWGDAHDIDDIERLVADMFAPVSRTHRITVEQMALLEPALSETLTNGCIAVIREGLERVVELGVPAEAAEDFLMGHLQIGIALIFERFDWRLSDGAQLALTRSRQQLFRDDWHRVFEPDEVMDSLRRITGGD